jgi:LacI family transcriptional regulator
MQERKRGYLDAMQDNNLLTDVSFQREARHNKVKEDIEKVIDELLSLELPIDALFFATNTLALNGLKYINKLKLQVPKDLAIICFDEGDAFDFYYCPLTYVKQPVEELGKEAVQLLLNQITNKSSGINGISLEAQLIVRKSCGVIN